MKKLSNYSHLIVDQWLTYKNRRNLGLVTVLVTFLLVLAIVLTPFGAFRGRIVNAAGLTTTDLNTITKEDLVQTIVGPGVSYSNVTYTGASVAAGTFSGGTGIIGFESGIVLSSGDIQNVIGPNDETDATSINGMPGDGNLSTLAGNSTSDAAVLEFDFVPETSSLSFQYVFGSEEYNEFANSQFNDVFAFYLDGVNIALIPSTTTPVAINTVNGGNPLGTNPQNPEFYRNNDFQNGTAPINTQLDGLTVVLTAQATVTPGQTYHIKLAIADTSDARFDSAVFIKSGSFVGMPTPTPTPTVTPTPTPTPSPSPTPTQIGPPTNKDQCKNGGWMTFNTPRTFKNQGDCIQFVNTGK